MTIACLSATTELDAIATFCSSLSLIVKFSSTDVKVQDLPSPSNDSKFLDFTQ